VTSSDATAQWRLVDEGWGRRAVDFATLSEPGNGREYVAMHQHLGVGRSTRLLDMACGAGLAMELASARGATCAGIDASRRLIAVATDRNPDADVRVGDMQDLPWAADSFDVVTSFRGIWGTTPGALAEAHRVLRPGGRLGLTVWGHIKASPGAWALSPFRLATEPRVSHQAQMVALGRPGAGEEVLGRMGFVDVRRLSIPMVWEFADPAGYARAIASTGPAYEAIQNVGEHEFLQHATRLAAARVRDGLPLRAEIDVVGFVARKPLAQRTRGSGFLTVPEPSEAVRRSYEHDVATIGFVMNASRAWAQAPALHDALFGLLDDAAQACSLTFRQRAILVMAAASVRGDSYCALAWGFKLSQREDADVATGVLRGDDDGLDAKERALAEWARQVVRDPNATTAADVTVLRAVGYGDTEIFAITTFVALRLAYSTINDALGVQPDAELAAVAPTVVKAVTYGRPIATCA
jgi:SAM-dependent methyltransferase/alkylhydroperoxidase family enzyme